ncbi:voltage-dependent calcium channel subunit alpha-2/delta-1-like isoform X1 [Branchiostoma lanceolatum]|uniref:voltage-dependent calcium channel subunit alpha-2/delta-1-like isoform X1 n=1 Tax=Branchiostoma lanceolatum TaxID=7740 RepID=UPI0034569287
MAPCGRLAAWALLALTGAVILSEAAGKRPFPQLRDVRTWARALATDLISIVDTAKFDELANAYANEVSQGRLSLQTINGTKLIETSTNEMANSIAVRTKALKSLSEAAENAVANHNYNQSIKVADVPYYSAMDGIPEHRLPGLSSDKWLGGQTNRTNSSIHIPVNIYEQDAHVLNVIAWSSHLDSVFIDNWQQNQEKLPWQAFASQTGVFRMYPARPMQPHRFGSRTLTLADVPRRFDEFDARMTQWYQQTISSPKDMLILLDTSGSVEGRSLSLMKHTTWFLLDRLTEDDYVATGYFNAYAQAVSCLSSFVQATTHNKEVIHKSLDNLNAANQANYYAGLEYAFKIFNNFEMEDRNENQGAECNRIIVLVTENAELYPEAVFQKYNPDRNIRVFVIVVGEPIHDWSVLQKMACDNRGYFSTVRSDGAAREASGDFGQVLSRPVALENSKEVTFSKIFMSEKGDDFEVYVSYPVINTTMVNPSYLAKDGSCKNDDGTCDNQAVLGVVSVPWPVKEMRKSLPLRELGHGGYAFIINNNGFVVLHPHLTPEDAFYSKPPTLDLLDIEFTNPDKEAMRNKMVKLETGSDVINTLTKTHDHHYIDEVQMTYHYGPVTGTGFSMGLGIPQYHPGSLDVSGVSYQEGYQAFESNSAGKLVLTPLYYCSNYTSSPHNCQDNLRCKVREKIADAHHLDQNKPEHCDEKMIQHVMLDAVVTGSHVTNRWQSLSSQFQSQGIDSMFISGASGLTRVFHGEAPFHHGDSFTATYFTRSLSNKDVYMFHTPRNEDMDPSDSINIVGAKAVKVPVQGQDILPAVAGANINADKVSDKMKDISETCGCGAGIGSHSSGCQAYTPTSCMTCADMDAECFLLDDGGFIIATTRDDSQDMIGNFLGDKDGSLMMSLLQHEVYERVESYDFAHPVDDSACAFLQKDNAAPRLFMPIAELLRLSWWTTSVAWGYLRYYVYGSLLSAWLSVVGAQNGPTPTPTTIYTEDPDELRHHCVAKQTQYRFFGDFATNDGFRPWSSSKEIKRDVPNCNCTREFAAVRLADTNLLFVIADENCGTCNNTRLAQSQHFDVGPDLCAYQPRFRRRPKRSCHKQHQQEDTTQCMSGSPVLYISTSLLAVVLTLQLVTYRFQTTIM